MMVARELFWEVGTSLLQTIIQNFCVELERRHMPRKKLGGAIQRLNMSLEAALQQPKVSGVSLLPVYKI